ncbi:hypothetical protein D3C87_1217970 [compost metagenome]
MISTAKVTAMLQRMALWAGETVNRFTLIRTRLEALESTTRALNSMTADKVGLGQVANHAPATTTQSVGGVNNSTTMTPRRTRDFAETNIYGPIGEAFAASTARLP